MKKFLIVLFLLITELCAGQNINVISIGLGKDFINNQPLINANFIVHNAYASYSIAIDNTVKSYDVGWTFKMKHWYFVPTLGITCVNESSAKRYYLQTVTDNDITITEIKVSVDGKGNVINNIPPIAHISGNSIVSVIDKIETGSTINYPNIGGFVSYYFNDGLVLFLKGTNNSFGFGIGCSIN